MPPGEATLAVEAEADPAATTLSAAELKRTASAVAVAVAVENLRVRTVLLPPQRIPVADRELSGAAQRPNVAADSR